MAGKKAKKDEGRGLPDGMPMMYGGSFAPKLTEDMLDGYKELIEDIDPTAAKHYGPVKDQMTRLAKMVEVFHETPESTRAGTPHPSGRGMVVPLAKEEVERIDAHVPWDYEVESLKELFDKIDPVEDKELRDAAHHLLWYAVELVKDREPMTLDRVGL